MKYRSEREKAGFVRILFRDAMESTIAAFDQEQDERAQHEKTHGEP